MLHRIAAWYNVKHLVELKRPKIFCCPNQSLTDPNWGRNEVFQHFLSLFIKRVKVLFHISWLHRISFTYNPTASFFRHRIVKWPWIKWKMRPMLFKKSWSLFYPNVARHPVKLACFKIYRVPVSSIFSMWTNSLLPWKQSDSDFCLVYLISK